MHLLIVSSYLPQPAWGAGTRSYYLLQALASRHRVSLLILSDNPEIDATPVAQLTDKVRIVGRHTWRSKRLQQIFTLLQRKSYLLTTQTAPELQAELDRLLNTDTYHAVLFESVLISNYTLPANIPMIIDQHNIEYELLQRTYQNEPAGIRKWFNGQESHLLRPIELDLCHRASLVVMTSEREQHKLQALLPQTTFAVVPNGVDTDHFTPATEDEEIPLRLIYTGSMDYYPNVDAVLFFARYCWPLIRQRLPQASWQIIGSNPSSEILQLATTPGITVTGAVPDVRPYLRQAAIALAPLRIGSGTRLKILEAMAMGKAIVSTAIGCEGLNAIPGLHLLVEERPEAIASAIIDLLRQKQKRRELGRAGRALVEQEYSWQRSGERLLQALEQTLVAGQPQESR